MPIGSIQNVEIRGIVTSVPPQIRQNSDFLDRFAETDIQKMEKMTGIKERRVVEDDVTTSDLCFHAATVLLKRLDWDPKTVDAIIFVSQTPDYTLPATACVLQHRLNLSTSCAAFDINLGCSGYVYGIWQAASLIGSGMLKRVLLLVGDTCTKFCSPLDSSTVFLFGDAGSATALEYSAAAFKMDFVLGSDGSGEHHLIIPSGGFRSPTRAQDLERTPQLDHFSRNRLDLYMNGSEIFNFTLRRVPELYHDLMAIDASATEPDQVVFHQANGFMLNHLAKKLKLSPEKVPTSIDYFGNTSSASIPLTMAKAWNKKAAGPTNYVLMGFGVGFSWAAARIRLAPTAIVTLETYESELV